MWKDVDSYAKAREDADLMVWKDADLMVWKDVDLKAIYIQFISKILKACVSNIISNDIMGW